MKNDSTVMKVYLVDIETCFCSLQYLSSACGTLIIPFYRWRKHKIPVSHIQQCHLLDYEHHLLSIVLSHCHYSLHHGKGQNVTYDYPALEKHLVDRFIHGKPLIQLEIPQVLYRKDVYSAMTFANIRKKVKPQVSHDE